MDLKKLAILDAGDVARLGTYRGLVQAIAEGHRHQPALCERLVYGPDDDGSGSPQRFMALPAWVPGATIGVKLVTVFPDNPSLGRPGIQAVVLLFDGETGEPVALLDGTELTYRKTAADSALGSQLLSKPDSATLLMVGAGGLAAHLIEAHRTVRPSIERVLIWNRTSAKAEKLVASGVADEVVSDLSSAVGQADIICTATMAREPLIEGDRLSPGTHLDCVGAYLPDHREVDDKVVERAEIFVDSYDAAVQEGGDLVIPLAAGTIGPSRILGDLASLVSNDGPTRSGPEAITMFENGGGGHLDLMVASHIYTQYRAESSTTGCL